jgi:hypothetical protein
MEVRVQHEQGLGVDRGAGIAGAFSRVRWGAVFAGLVVATALQVVLTVLGAAIGLTALDGPDSARSFGIGTAIWALLVPLVTLFIGGKTAGHLANVRDRVDGFLHGTLVWGLSLLMATYLLGTGASRVLGGTLNLAGNITGTAVSAAGNVAAGQDVDAGALQSARARIESEARARGLSEAEVQAQVARVQESAGEVADKAQSVAASGAWLALLALGLSLAAAAFGALRGVRDNDPVTVAAAR